MPTLNTTAQLLSHWCAQQLQALFSAPCQILAYPLRVEASHREFYRLQDALSDRSWVAMSSPPTLENNEQFVALAKLFYGLGTPKLLAADQVNGFFLMEDLGSVHLSDAYLRDGADQTALADILNLALDALKPLQGLADPQIPPYTEARLIMEFDLCAEWFARGLMSIPLSADDQTALAAARSTLVDAMLEQPQVCVHRDYHCRNLLLSGDPDNPRIGMVDFQDALIGPALYDAASLLQDCYAVHDDAVIGTALHRFASRNEVLAGKAQEQVTWWHDACAIQRRIKAVGIFARLHLRDGKSSHLHYIPSVLARTSALAAAHDATQMLSPLLGEWAEQAATNSLLTGNDAS